MDVPECVLREVNSLLAPYGEKYGKGDGRPQRKYMTARQASEYCGLSAKFIKVLAVRGEIGSTRAGVKVLVLASDLDEYLNKNKAEKKKGAEK